MAAKVLLGVVALTTIVGSPFAYNHFKAPSGETQKEEEKVTGKQPVTAEKPADSVPEVASDSPEVNVQAPQPQNPVVKGPTDEVNQKVREASEERSDAVSNPKTRDDVCELGERTKWESTGGPLSKESRCVRQVVENQRTPQR